MPGAVGESLWGQKEQQVLETGEALQTGHCRSEGQGEAGAGGRSYGRPGGTLVHILNTVERQ